MSVIKLSFTSSDQITSEVNDALNLMGMYACVEQGLMTQEEYDEKVREFEAKYPS